MFFNKKFLVEKTADIGSNIRIYMISSIVYKILQSENNTAVASFFNKKPCIFLLITNGLIEIISVIDGKKTIIKTSHDVSLSESMLLSLESELNCA
ncbi:hypothetical protein KAJ27_04150 [bacterium]|nr:hypothetical protein [bacterium]